MPDSASAVVRSRKSLARFVIEQEATRKAAAAAFRVSAKTAAKWTKAVPPRRSRWFEGSQFATATQSTSFARTT